MRSEFVFSGRDLYDIFESSDEIRVVVKAASESCFSDAFSVGEHFFAAAMRLLVKYFITVVKQYFLKIRHN